MLGKTKKGPYIMKKSPCGGCPPCCKQCVFSSGGEKTVISSVVVSAKEYGCVKGFGDIVKDVKGRLGQIRGQLFHPISETGLKFLKESNNSLVENAT